LSVHFPETTFIRLKALAGLTAADLCLIYDKWITFFVLIALAIGLEFLYRSLHEVLLHNHEVEKTKQKIAERRAHQLAMQEAGVHK
jgi:putative Mn2+ efflux pump MntP